MQPRARPQTLIEHAPPTLIESSDEEPCIEDGCAPEFARARQIERLMNRLKEDLKAKHQVVVKEYEDFEDLKEIARQVFTSVYMCKTQLDTAVEEKCWDDVRKVKNVLYACQEAIRGYPGEKLWEEKQEMDESD